MSLLNLALLQRWGLVGSSEQDFSQMTTSSHTERLYLSLPTQLPPNTTSKQCHTWHYLGVTLGKGNWVFQDQFAHTQFSYIPDYAGEKSPRPVWLTLHTLTCCFSLGKLDHHLPCSKGWGFFSPTSQQCWYLHLLSHIHLPPELMEWVGTSGE